LSESFNEGEDEVTKEEELIEEDLEYESDSSYQAPPVGQVIVLVPIDEEEDEVCQMTSCSFLLVDHLGILVYPGSRRELGPVEGMSSS